MECIVPRVYLSIFLGQYGPEERIMAKEFDSLGFPASITYKMLDGNNEFPIALIQHSVMVNEGSSSDKYTHFARYVSENGGYELTMTRDTEGVVRIHRPPQKIAKTL